MIEKRYEFYSREGVKWTEWTPYCPDDSLLKEFQTKEKWQLTNKLRNEFRVV